MPLILSGRQSPAPPWTIITGFCIVLTFCCAWIVYHARLLDL